MVGGAGFKQSIAVGEISSDGAVRTRNIWGEKHIDMSKEFAMKALVLGFLP